MVDLSDKTICIECKFCEGIDLPYQHGKTCSIEPEKESKSYVTGITYMFKIVYCVSKNKGNCKDYVPLILEDRLDFLLEQGRKRLVDGIAPIFSNLDNYWSDFNCFSREIFRTLCVLHDIPEKILMLDSKKDAEQFGFDNINPKKG